MMKNTKTKSKTSSKHHKHKKTRSHHSIHKNKHTLFAMGEPALKASANAGLFDKLTIKEACQFRQLSKTWRFFIDNNLEHRLALAKKFDLVDDYHAYLQEAIQDDSVLLQDYSWETMFALFARQKREIQNKITTLYKEDFNDWDPSLWNRSKLEEDKKEQLSIWLLRHAAKGEFVSVYYLLKAKASVVLRNSDLNFPHTDWGDSKIYGIGTALDGAACWGSLACTKLLYGNLQTKKILELPIVDNDFFTPIHHLAISVNPYDYLNPDLVKFYIDHGIDINSKSRFDLRTPLHLAVIEYPIHALMVNAFDKKTGKKLTHEMRDILQTKTKEYFFQEKVNVDFDNFNINSSAWEKSFGLIDTLINYGANLYSRDKFGMQPVHYAYIPLILCKKKFNDDRKHYLHFIGKSYLEKCRKSNDHNKFNIARFSVLCGQKLHSHLAEKMNQLPEESFTTPLNATDVKLRVSKK